MNNLCLIIKNTVQAEFGTFLEAEVKVKKEGRLGNEFSEGKNR